MQNKNMRGDEYFEQKNRISQRKGILRETILTCLTWVGLMKEKNAKNLGTLPL